MREMIAEIVKTVLTNPEAGDEVVTKAAGSERIEALEAELAQVKALAAPSGPRRFAPAVSADNAIVKSKAASLRAKAAQTQDRCACSRLPANGRRLGQVTLTDTAYIQGVSTMAEAPKVADLYGDLSAKEAASRHEDYLATLNDSIAKGLAGETTIPGQAPAPSAVKAMESIVANPAITKSMSPDALASLTTALETQRARFSPRTSRSPAQSAPALLPSTLKHLPS
jgi:hypothetical protein